MDEAASKVNPAWLTVIGAGSLVAIYVAGFLAWALYAGSIGIGFLPVAIPRLVAAGLIVTAISLWALASNLFFSLLAYHLLHELRNRLIDRWAVSLCISTISACIAFIVVYYYGGVFNAESPRTFRVGAATLSFALGFALAILSDAVDLPQHFPRKKHRLPSRPNKWKLDGGPPKPGLKFGRLAWNLVSWMLFLSLLTGILFLPGIPATLGGAAPRHAYFSMEPNQLDNVTRNALFGTDGNGSHSERSNRLTILFYDSQSFFVRVPPMDKPKDASYEIPASQVKTVIWID